ncbi:MAG: N-methyl-L-tryptophan oxidase [Alphaproteobacteria bacterium]
MSKTYDVIVAGVGAHGSAACWRVAQRGLRVLGLERFSIPHDRGSSHGVNRIIRLAYFEHPDYVPLLRRAYELWRDTERACGEQLLFITGGVDAGTAQGGLITGSLRSCRNHGLDHELLDARALCRRYPGFRLPDDFVAVFQPQGGFVACERALTAQAALAHACGAEIHENEPITAWERAGERVRVNTAHSTYEAGQLIVSCGAWVGDFVPELKDIAVAERQVLGWFEPKRPELFQPGSFPVSIIESERGLCYQLPVWGTPGFKLGVYGHLHETGHADTLMCPPGTRDEALLRIACEEFFPDAAGPTLQMQSCLFTNVSDGHFVVDRLPELPQVIVASPCSGHGFKFACVMGEVLADMVTRGTTSFDLKLFSLARFSRR